MNEFSNAISVSAAGLKAQASRLRHVSENISNADTPGYRRKQVSFTALVDAPGDPRAVKPGRLSLDRSPLERIYDPAHPLAAADGYYDGANVNMIVEIADAREAQRSYEANLRMFDQTRKMIASLFELLRR